MDTKGFGTPTEMNLLNKSFSVAQDAKGFGGPTECP